MSTPAPVFAPPPRTRGAPPRPRAGHAARYVGFGALAVVIALVASTVRPGRGSAFTYSKRVDEVVREPARYVGTDVRIEGLVTAGSLEHTSGSRDYRFAIEANRATLPVHFAGIVPDTFREGSGVTVLGRLEPSGSFEARELVAKCPSKYEMQAARGQGAQMPGGVPGTTVP